MPTEFEWDEEKDRANQDKHGISFEDATTIFDGPVLAAPDERQDYGEERFISTGQLGTLVVVVVVHQPQRAHPADFGPQGQPQRKAGVL